jgi:hypothetical protein
MVAGFGVTHTSTISYSGKDYEIDVIGDNSEWIPNP